MIGNKITINGVEWEEIDGYEWTSEKTEDWVQIYNNGQRTLYKKVEKQVFPKVFEDGLRKVFVYGNGDMIFSSVHSNNEILFSDSIPLVIQALAFRDKLLEKKNE
jgi:hypothetical protein